MNIAAYVDRGGDRLAYRRRFARTIGEEYIADESELEPDPDGGRHVPRHYDDELIGEQAVASGGLTGPGGAAAAGWLSESC